MRRAFDFAASRAARIDQRIIDSGFLIPTCPNLNPAFNGPVISGTVDKWFDPSAFVMPLAGTFGNVSRGSFAGPGFNVNEKMNLQLRVEAFNLFNHANFSSPNPIILSGNNYSSSAGVITTTSTYSRQIQFALKLMF